MPRFDDKFLDELKAKNDIIEVISSIIPTQRKGRDHWACCPFHNEKTPSLSISSNMQIFKCFGCGKAGSVITFIQEYYKIPYIEAVQFLADRVHMTVPQLDADPKYAEMKALREKTYQMNREAALFYHKNLASENGAAGREYLEGRGFTWDTVTTFGIGYSSDYASLPKYMTEKGYSIETLYTVGLVGKAEDSKAPYDFFAKRLIVPIINAMGQVIAFSGRSLEKNPNFVKYKNTIQTAVFTKGKNLFGINLYRKYHQGKVRAMVLVEGHLDVVSLYQAGIRNAVASMGTALTTEQCNEIKRNADLVYVSFDGDSAGQAATLKGMDLLKSTGVDLKIVELTDNLDPDDYVRKFGKEGYEKLLNEALSLPDYKLKLAERKHDIKKNDEKAKFLKEALAVVNELDEVERAVYIKDISQKTGIDASQMEYTVTEAAKPKAQRREDGGKEAEEALLNYGTPANLTAARFVLACMLSAFKFVSIEDVDLSLFCDERHRRICEYIIRCAVNKKPPSGSDLFDILEGDSEAGKILGAIDLDAVDTVTDEMREVFYRASVNLLKKLRISKEKEALLADYSNETDKEKKELIRLKINDLIAQAKK